MVEPRPVSLGPASVSARHYGDIRMLAVASRALVLQVAHPVVGAGVAQHSDFVADPWGRLVRTLDAVVPVVYGTDTRARAVGEALRRSHRGIVGTDDQGRRYSALDPEAYHWVHATLLDAVLTAAKVFGPTLAPADVPRLYEEYGIAAEHLGVDARQVPDTFAAWDEYRRTMIAERLEDNVAVRDVFATLRRPVVPPVVPDALAAAWPVAWAPVGHLARVSALALLPRILRQRLGLRLRRTEQAEFRLLAASVRAAFAVLPPVARELPQVRRERRHTALAAG